VQIGPRSLVHRSILWDDVTVGADCRLDECIVTDRARLPDGASYRRSVLVAGDDGGLVSVPLQLD
jgi:ADP-glucose pyrophosphorylase